MEYPNLDEAIYLRVIQDFKASRISTDDVKHLLPEKIVGMLDVVRFLPEQICLSYLNSNPIFKEAVANIYHNVYLYKREEPMDESPAESKDANVPTSSQMQDEDKQGRKRKFDEISDGDYKRVIIDWKEGTLFHTHVGHVLSKEEVDMLNEAKNIENPEESVTFLKKYPNSKRIIQKTYQNIYSKEKSSKEKKSEDFYKTTIENFLQITGGDTVCRKNGENMTPLAEAALTGNMEKVESLLENSEINTDAVHERDDSRSTPLMMAAIGNYLEVAKRLIDRGANVNQRDKAGDTALTLAARRGNKKVVELLVQNEANLDIEGESDQPAVVAAREGIGRYLSYYTRARREERGETLEYLQDVIFKDFENEDEAESGDEECDINVVEKEETNPFKAVYSRGALYEIDQKYMTDTIFYNVFYLTTI